MFRFLYKANADQFHEFIQTYLSLINNLVVHYFGTDCIDGRLAATEHCDVRSWHMHLLFSLHLYRLYFGLKDTTVAR